MGSPCDPIRAMRWDVPNAERKVARRSKKPRKKRVQEAPEHVAKAGVVTPPAMPSSTGSAPVPPPSANARRRPRNETVQLKLRFSEALRRQLEQAATQNGRSMNAEIISRLETSFISPGHIPRLVANALLKGLDPAVVEAMSDTIIEDWQSDQAASSYDWREDQFDREGK